MSDYIVKLRNYEIVVECNRADYSEERFAEYHKLLMWHEWKICEIMHGNDKVATMCKVGLNQIADVDEFWFGDENVKKMFFERLRVLEAAIPNGGLKGNYVHN